MTSVCYFDQDNKTVFIPAFLLFFSPTAPPRRQVVSVNGVQASGLTVEARTRSPLSPSAGVFFFAAPGYVPKSPWPCVGNLRLQAAASQSPTEPNRFCLFELFAVDSESCQKYSVSRWSAHFQQCGWSCTDVLCSAGACICLGPRLTTCRARFSEPALHIVIYIYICIYVCVYIYIYIHTHIHILYIYIHT